MQMKTKTETGDHEKKRKHGVCGGQNTSGVWWEGSVEHVSFKPEVEERMSDRWCEIWN